MFRGQVLLGRPEPSRRDAATRSVVLDQGLTSKTGSACGFKGRSGRGARSCIIPGGMLSSNQRQRFGDPTPKQRQGRRADARVIGYELPRPVERNCGSCDGRRNSSVRRNTRRCRCSLPNGRSIGARRPPATRSLTIRPSRRTLRRIGYSDHRYKQTPHLDQTSRFTVGCRLGKRWDRLQRSGRGVRSGQQRRGQGDRTGLRVSADCLRRHQSLANGAAEARLTSPTPSSPRPCPWPCGWPGA